MIKKMLPFQLQIKLTSTIEVYKMTSNNQLLALMKLKNKIIWKIVLNKCSTNRWLKVKYYNKKLSKLKPLKCMRLYITARLK